MNAAYFRLLLNIYPPYWGTGIVVKKISPDYKEIIVQMKMKWYNRNYVGTHFGGSLYAMTDPFFMLMLIQILGNEYIVWDKGAHIDFIKPGHGTLTAKFTINDEQIDDIFNNTLSGNKYLPQFSVDITNEFNETVARVNKLLYVRKKVKNNSI
ncbi:MAG TPA: tetrameric acyl-CoA thioesterase [Syntrophobacteraceae bacterium]|nr:tetrameric acyl-CoA thioesterase [Syntrophobacteraceae bacterium]